MAFFKVLPAVTALPNTVQRDYILLILFTGLRLTNLNLNPFEEVTSWPMEAR